MRSKNLTRYSPAVLVALAALTATAPSAWGQNALGDGRQLDNSLSTQTRYNATRLDPASEFRFRNAVATGNAPGGLSLRADVGYRAANEFRGDLGSDDLFSFRRDSLYSGLAGMGIRGTDAIQYQFALTTGSRLPQNIVGNAMVLRGGARVSTTSGEYSTATPIRRPTVYEVEESDRLTGMLRSPSTYATTRSLRPVFLGNVANLSGEVKEQGVSASGLRGIRIIEMGAAAGSEQAQQQRVLTAHDTILESLRVRSQIDNSAAETDATPELTEQPEDWRSRLAALRRELLMGQTETPADGTETTGESSGDDPETDGPGTPGDVIPGVPGGPAAPMDTSEPKPAMRFDPETLELLRPDGEVIDALIRPDSPVDSVYVGHMQTGQHLLSVGRYFDAEERFTRALSIRAGDVAAQVGRLHAQLGAGLFISAGLNLRELMMTSPEVAATRFAAGLLPSEERAAELMILLRERAGLVEGHESNDLTLRREASLLLAYLSYQRDEQELVVAGLHAAEQTLSETELANRVADERLIAYLTQLWIPSDTSEPEDE